MKTLQLYALLLLVLISPLSLSAQNEVVREQISLEGLQEIGFTANIEGSIEIANSDTLTPTIIRQQTVNQLVDANIRYVQDEEVESSADIPFLHMHINVMQMENGLIPFSINLRLHQPVKLMLNRDLETTATTWETGLVGLVSFDQLPVINQAAGGLVETFIEDFDKSNPGRISHR
ncbi:MAG: hypothetical protein WEA58_13310 [Balneolaceae bacterium]